MDNITKKYLSDLTIGEKTDIVLVVKDKQERKTKKGDPYLALKLGDKSGEINANFWDSFQAVKDKIVIDSFVSFAVEVGEFQGKKQLTIKKAEPVDSSKVDLGDYLPKTTKDIEKMYAHLIEIIKTVQDPDLKNLLDAFFADEKFVNNYKKAPAAKSMHSACIGGLLEHVDQMLCLAEFVINSYENINRDILITGIILHDIGKLEELEYEVSFQYSDYGKLVGHHVIGVNMLNEKINKLEKFPDKKKMILEHMIISHHGMPEWGSPRQPATLEAVVLHYLDNIDAKIVGFNDFVENNRQEGSNWTPKSYMFDNQELYIP